MKKVLIVSMILMGFLVGCSKESKQPLYSKNAPEYIFFKEIADSIPLLDPDKKITLIALDCGDITNYDVMPELYRAVGGQLDIHQIPSKYVLDFVKQVAMSFADRNMFMADAKEHGITVSEEKIEEELKLIWSDPRFGGTEEDFKNFIESQGFTMDMVRKDIHDGLVFQAYLEQVIDPTIDVSEDVLQEAYKQPVTATVRHILLSTQGQTPEEKAKTREKMEGILEKARSGEDFSKLVKEYSEDLGSKDQGGLYENFSRGQMVPAFEDAAFTEPIGTITDIVETPFGFHILKILDRKFETRPYEEVRDSLLENELVVLRNSAIEARLEELKKKYNYSIKF
ncbi:MAG: peptidyl-prolyl cis-trans isomerase [Candidatus Marinimicrobia bacterium]|nr:peptidyl-prolyl cis-trans isomerase [Candidatus Neomarinimicrobiota bacterium]MDD5582256.1 peptidyl-prolyl cis-trans isomerase [Candidatus Neomarinimicrobiota bacterium]